eukprot:scaffold1661_cov251-Pinguiococcus_pyrenoidosus.AAC.28
MRHLRLSSALGACVMLCVVLSAFGALSLIPKAAPVLFCPAQLSVGDDYGDFFALLREGYGREVVCADLRRFDWARLAPSFASRAYWAGELQPKPVLDFYFEAMDRAVDALPPDSRINVLAHSIGGWIARAYFAEVCSEELRSRVTTFTTLGTPHVPPPADSAWASIDQTRGLLSYVNNKYPGAYLKGVKYTSVIGAGPKLDGVEKSLLAPFAKQERARSASMAKGGGRPKRRRRTGACLGIAGNPATSKTFGSISWGQPAHSRLQVGFASYLPLSGTGGGFGDGIVPETVGILPESQSIILPGVKHANFVPTFPRAIRLDLKWYGSEDVVPEWISVLK